MKRSTSVFAAGVLASGVLLLPTAPAAAGQFHTDILDDFNCDGLSDDVYLEPGNDVGDARGAGSVTIYFSSGTVYEQTISQNTPGIPGTAETGDSFGRTYASTDFNHDGCDELIVGSPGEDDEAGMITVMRGSANGIVSDGAVAYTQNSPDVPGSSEDLDGFGETLVAGATDSGEAYLLVGSPGESIGSRAGAGSVYYLRNGGWSAFHQDTPGVAGTAEGWDRFGLSIAASEHYFVVGAPGETLGGDSDAGQVHVFSHTVADGVPNPLTTISQDSTGISGSAEWNDAFGESVSIVSYRPSASAPIGALLAIGSPTETLGSDEAAGMAHVIAVTPTGKFTEVADINQDTTGVTGSTEEDDTFGADLVFGIEGGGPVATPATAVLAVSALWEDSTDDDWGGAIQVFTDVKSPGTGDLFFNGDDAPFGGATFVDSMASTPEHLMVGWGGDFHTTVAWSEILGG